MKRPNPGLMVALMSWLALAAAQTPSSTNRISVQWQNVDILVLADAVGQATGTTFIPDPRVRAPSVSLINPNARPMTPQELYQAFLQVLQVNGFAAVRSGCNSRLVKIVPADAVRQMANGCLTAANAGSDEIVDEVIEVKNLNATQINVLLRQLIPTPGSILAVTGTNSMIMTDRASNVVRIKRLVQQLDMAGSSGVDMIKLENSDAASVVKTLTALMAGNPADAGGSAAPRIQADERTNSVLVSGDAAARQRAATYIANLDQQIADSNNMEIRRLKYANSDDMATMLKAQAGAATTTTGAGGAGAAAAASGPAADRTVNIQSYKATNTLIITAPPKDRKRLLAIVDALDVERAQVQIDAFIADVTMDKSNDLGVNWALFSQEDGKVVPGALFNSPIGGPGGDLATVANLIENASSATGAPGGFTGGFAKILDSGVSWAAMVRAIASNTNTNVVAMPTQVTLDNQEVNLESGQNVPFLSGSYTSLGNTGGAAGAGGGGIGNPFTTVNRQDIGTKLKITPQLNGSDAMTLTIDLESSELSGQTGDAGSQITNKRTFHNVVLVRDQQTIVVGGLIRDSETTAETRVPFLGSIPLIGNLFKTRNAVRSKKNLMVFIRPTILKSNLQTAATTDEKIRQVRELQQAQDKDKQAPPMLPGNTPPLMPLAPPPPPADTATKTSPVP